MVSEKLPGKTISECVFTESFLDTGSFYYGFYS